MILIMYKELNKYNVRSNSNPILRIILIMSQKI